MLLKFIDAYDYAIVINKSKIKINREYKKYWWQNMECQIHSQQ